MNSENLNPIDSPKNPLSNQSSPPWLDKLILALIIILAIIPTGLVVADRWLEILDPKVFYNLWCASETLCSFKMPSYFLIIFACIVLLTGLIYIQRKRVPVVFEETYRRIVYTPLIIGQKRLGYVYIGISSIAFIAILINCLVTSTLPDWNLVYTWLVFIFGFMLITISLESIKSRFTEEADYNLALLLAHLSIIALMVGLYGKTDLLWSTAVLLLLALFNLWRYRRRIPPIYWIVSLALIGFCLQIDDWRTAVVGDEYNYLLTAIDMAEKWSYTTLGNHIFLANRNASYPFFPSLFHAITMKFLGEDNLGWRFSNAYLGAISVGFFYYFCRSFLSKRISLITAILFASSSYIMSFSKIGYDNLQALFAFTLSAAAGAWAIRSQTKLAFVCLGSALALCFYVFPAALYVVPLILIFLFLYYSPFDKHKVQNWGLMFTVWMAMIFPLLVQPSYWNGKIAGTLFNQPALVNSVPVLVNHFITTFVYSLFSFLYLFKESHFVASSYVDPLTGSLMLIGLPVLFFQAKRQRFPLFILFTFFYLVFVIGTTHDRATPPNTRMFLLIPIYTLIAAWGVVWVWDLIGSVKPVSQRSSHIIIGLFISLVVGLNLYQAYPLSHNRFVYQQSYEAVFIRAAKQISPIERHTVKTFVVIVDNTWGVNGLQMLQQAYPELAYIKIEQINISKPIIPDEFVPLLKARNTFIFFFAGMDQSWLKPLDEQIRGYSKKPCTLYSLFGFKPFVYYRDTSLQPTCSP